MPSATPDTVKPRSIRWVGAGDKPNVTRGWTSRWTRIGFRQDREDAYAKSVLALFPPEPCGLCITWAEGTAEDPHDGPATITHVASGAAVLYGLPSPSTAKAALLWLVQLWPGWATLGSDTAVPAEVVRRIGAIRVQPSAQASVGRDWVYPWNAPWVEGIYALDHAMLVGAKGKNTKALRETRALLKQLPESSLWTHERAPNGARQNALPVWEVLGRTPERRVHELLVQHRAYLHPLDAARLVDAPSPSENA